jgi:hypothetical protein
MTACGAASRWSLLPVLGSMFCLKMSPPPTKCFLPLTIMPSAPLVVAASSSTEEPVAAAYSSMTSADSGALPGYDQQPAVSLPPEVIRAFLQQQQHQPSDPGDNGSEVGNYSQAAT